MREPEETRCAVRHRRLHLCHARTWMAYMDFLNVSKEALPDEFNSTDLHQYMFDLGKNIYVMNHTIPSSNFSLLFAVWRR